MAGVNGPEIERGVWSELARAQYAAMARLRWRIFVNGLRSKMGAFELGARTVTFSIYAVFGLGLGFVAGLCAFLLASEEKWLFLPLLYWGVCILWQVLPVMLASFQEQFDLGILLRFPVSFGPYYLLYVVFGLADVSTILGLLCSLGIWIGITLVRPELFAWTALGLALFAAFNLLLVRAVFAWIDRWLSQRKTREILGAIFMLLMLSLQLLNPALHQRRHPMPSRSMTPEQARQRVEESRQQNAAFIAKYGRWLVTVDTVQGWFPPGLAAHALERGAEDNPVPALASAGLLGLWTLAAGVALGWRLRAEYKGEELSSAPRREKQRAKAATRADSGLRAGAWPGGSSSMAALLEKEARSLMRTLPQIWALVMPLLMVLVLASVFHNGATGSSFRYALPLCVAYSLLGFTQLFYNNLGAEGAGIQLLFLSPTPIRKVFLAKNLFHSLLFCVDALLAGLLVSLRMGWPDGMIAAATVAWILFALLCSLAAGNILSLTMPYRVNPGRISRQRGSQANALTSVLAQFGMLGVGAAVFALGWLLEIPWLAVPVFLLLGAAAFFVWLRVLGKIDTIANQRRDTLMAKLMKTD
ncbi:MAG: hypothetical protein WCA21_16075 [Terracidiphilus sp.]